MRHRFVEPTTVPDTPHRHALWCMRAARLVAAAACAFAALAGGSPALAQPAVAQRAPAHVTPSAMRAGSLLLKTNEEGRYVEAPRLGTDVDITVSGPTARARVTQMFQNPTDGWVEAVYVSPLPETSAVDSLKMVIGERVVIGEIKERRQAREIYEQAKNAGKKATLLEQERPNMFTNSVANIGPGETVLVQIEYQETVKQSAGVFSLRVPLVVAPRYNPAPVVQSVDFNPQNQGWGTASDPVPDRSRIEPPVLDPRQHSPTNPVSIAVRLQAGFPVGEVKSHHHQVKTESDGEDVRIINLVGGMTPADRDFELTWQPAAAAAPSVGLFQEQVGDSDYVLAFITPPVLKQTDDQRPREIVFVVDNSGSMGGTSIVQAKASLLYALGRLRPFDRFNVIRFDNTMDVLFADTVPADVENLAKAKGFVSALEARGGTEMLPAMKAALTDAPGADSKYLRQVVFLTDGAIGNEQQLLDTISDMRGRSRVFMVGIGSAPNSFLMNRAAELGRGTFTQIGSADQVDDRMRSLFEKLESPVVTGLSATFPGAQSDITPQFLPDLYRGEPLVIAVKVNSLSGTLRIEGRIGEQPWTVTMPLANAAKGLGLSKLWARRKIADAEVARSLRRMTPEQADNRILDLALTHHLVTRLTSLVAVDQTPSRPDGARLTRADVPLNLPAGWEFDKVFGGEQPKVLQRRANAPTLVTPAAFASVARTATAQPAAVSAAKSVRLPQTATDAELRMLAGGLLLLTSFVLVLWRRRARPCVA